MTALELINKIILEHDRSSCSDSDTQNSFYFEGGDQERSRCIRCSMLKVVEMGNDLLDNFDFHKVIYG